VIRLLLAHGMLPTLIGLGAGLLTALIATPVMESLLFGVSPRDPVTFIAVPLLLAAVAVLACWVPARRAIRVEQQRMGISPADGRAGQAILRALRP